MPAVSLFIHGLLLGLFLNSYQAVGSTRTCEAKRQPLIEFQKQPLLHDIIGSESIGVEIEEESAGSLLIYVTSVNAITLLTLPCFVTGPKKISYYWIYHSQVPVNKKIDDQKASSVLETGNLTAKNGDLKLHSLNKSIDGTYQCAVKTEYGTALSQIISLQLVYSRLDTIVRKQILKVHHGEYVVLNGKEIISQLLVFQKWTKTNSQNVEDGAEHDSLNLIDNHFRLHIKSFQWNSTDLANESWTFRQFYKNPLSNRSILRAEYVVLYEPDDKYSLMFLEKLENEMTAVYVPTLVSLIEGHQLRLTCIFSGWPTPQVTIWKSEDGKMCSENARPATYFKDYLFIPNANASISGNYCCQVEQGNRVKFLSTVVVSVLNGKPTDVKLNDILLQPGFADTENVLAENCFGNSLPSDNTSLNTDLYQQFKESNSVVCQKTTTNRFGFTVSNFVVKRIKQATVSLVKQSDAITDGFATFRCEASADSELPFSLVWKISHFHEQFVLNSSETVNQFGFFISAVFSEVELDGFQVRQSSVINVSSSETIHSHGKTGSYRTKYSCIVLNGCNTACSRLYAGSQHTYGQPCQIGTIQLDCLANMFASKFKLLGNRQYTTEVPPEFLLEPALVHMSKFKAEGVTFVQNMYDYSVLLVPTYKSDSIRFTIPCYAFANPPIITYAWNTPWVSETRQLLINRSAITGDDFEANLLVSTTVAELRRVLGYYQCFAKSRLGELASNKILLSISAMHEEFDTIYATIISFSRYYMTENHSLLLSLAYPFEYNGLEIKDTIFAHKSNHSQDWIHSEGNTFDINPSGDFEAMKVNLYDWKPMRKPFSRVRDCVLVSNFDYDSLVSRENIAVISQTKITVKPTNVLNATIGSIIKFACDATGDDALTLRIDWYARRNGDVTPIYPNEPGNHSLYRIVAENFTLTSNSQRVSETLLINTTSITGLDLFKLVGEYVCNATNDGSYSLASAVFDISEKQKINFVTASTQLINEVKRFLYDNKTYFTKHAPHILLEPTMVDINLKRLVDYVHWFGPHWLQVIQPDDNSILDSELVLPCYAFANPPNLRYEWFHNDEENNVTVLVKKSTNHKQDTGIGNLVIKLFDKRLHGTYQCRITGVYGVALTSLLKISVYTKKVLCDYCNYFFENNRPLQTVYVSRNSNQTLKCRIPFDNKQENRSSSLTILENGVAMPYGDVRDNIFLYSSVMEERSNKGRAFFLQAQYEIFNPDIEKDNRNLQCDFKTAWYPNFVSSAALVVISPTEIVRKPLHAHKVHYGLQVEFRCDAIGVDILDLRFQWFKEQRGVKTRLYPERTYWDKAWRISIRHNYDVNIWKGNCSISETLIIRTGMFSDSDFPKLAGKYICEATNDVSTDMAWAWLSFYGEINHELQEAPPISAFGPVLLSAPIRVVSDQVLKILEIGRYYDHIFFWHSEENTFFQAKLPCCASSNPPKKAFKWLVNDTLIESSTRDLQWRVDSNSKEDCTDVLVRRIRKGTFQCVISTLNGTALSKKITIQVIGGRALKKNAWEVKNDTLRFPSLLKSRFIPINWEAYIQYSRKKSPNYYSEASSSIALKDNEAVTTDEQGRLHILLHSINVLQFPRVTHLKTKFFDNRTVRFSSALDNTQKSDFLMRYEINMMEILQAAGQPRDFSYVTPGEFSILLGDNGRFVCIWSGHLILFFKQTPSGLVPCKNATDYNKPTTGALFNAFVFVNANLSDAGTYVCKAFDLNGNFKGNRTFEVKVLVPPYFSPQLPTQIIVPIGRKAFFQCKAFGIPKPSLIFLENTAPVDFSKSRVEITDYTDGSQTYVVGTYETNVLAYGESRVVQCIARNNEVYEAVANVALVVVDPPHLLRIPKNYTLTTQDTFIELACDATVDRLFSPSHLLFHFTAFGSNLTTEVVPTLHNETGLWLMEFRNTLTNKILYDYKTSKLFIRPFLLRPEELPRISGKYVCFVNGTGEFAQFARYRTIRTVQAASIVSFKSKLSVDFSRASTSHAGMLSPFLVLTCLFIYIVVTV